jgi:GntR family transcriptional regulator
VQRLEPFVTTLSAGPLPTAPELGLSGGEGESAFAEIRSRGRTPHASAPKVSVQLAPDHVAARLRVLPGTQVVCRYQERCIDDMPWSLQTSYYPFEFVTMGATDLVRAESIPVGAASYLEQRLGLVQVGYRERVLVRQPTKDEARFFGLPDDGRISVVTLVRTSYWASEAGPVPFRVTFTVLPADRNQLVVDSGAVPDELATAAVA